MARISQETIDQVNAVSILELAEAFGDSPVRKGKQYNIFCPNPNHTEGTPDTYIEPAKNIFKCFGAGGCGATGNSSIAYYAWHEFGEYDPKAHFLKAIKGVAELMGIPVKLENGEVLKKGSVDYKPRKAMPRAVVLESQTPQIVDQVYRAFLSLCPVRQEHMNEWVNERRYSMEDVQTMMLRSVPSPEEWLQIYSLMASKGYPFERIPGFSQRFIPEGYELPVPAELAEYDHERKGHWVYVPSAGQGYFIPVRDEFGRIVRLRVRREQGSPKYIWFSSENNLEIEKNPLRQRRNGVSSGAPLNIAVPTLALRSWNPGDALTDTFRTDVILATEGEHKSAISANKLNIPVVGVPGVGGYRDILRLIDSWNVQKLIIAYDMDTLQKVDTSEDPEKKLKSEKKQKSLFEILTEFAKAAMATGVEVSLWTWNLADGKGLDDLLLNNRLPTEVNLRTGARKMVNLAEI